MSKFRFYAFSFLVILCSLGCADESPALAECECLSVNPRPFRATFRNLEGNGLGYPSGYSSVDLFLSPYLDDFSLVPMVDIRSHFFNNGKFALNTGIIGRYHKKDKVFGVNLFYDYRNARCGRFNQAGVGLEVLGTHWDLRMNGYIPFGVKHSPICSSIEPAGLGEGLEEFADKLEEAFFGSSQPKLREVAMKGFDAEVGVHTRCRDPWGFYAGIIPYGYTGGSKHAWGGKLRLQAQWTDYVTLEVLGAYDSLFLFTAQAQLSLNIPFGAKKPTRCPAEWKSRMVDPVLRNEIIATRRQRLE